MIFPKSLAIYFISYSLQLAVAREFDSSRSDNVSSFTVVSSWVVLILD